jgi:hypothetical protein
LIGPGIVFYPVERIQVASTIGYASLAVGDSSGNISVGGDGGIGYSLSVAYDLQVYRGNAILMGVKWAQASFPTNSISYDLYGINIFIGYSFRTGKGKDTSRQSLAPAENQDNLSTYQHSSSRSSNGENSNYQNSSSANSSPSQRERELEKENAMLKGKVEAYEKMLNTRK